MPADTFNVPGSNSICLYMASLGGSTLEYGHTVSMTFCKAVDINTVHWTNSGLVFPFEFLIENKNGY